MMMDREHKATAATGFDRERETRALRAEGLRVEWVDSSQPFALSGSTVRMSDRLDRYGVAIAVVDVMSLLLQRARCAGGRDEEARPA